MEADVTTKHRKRQLLRLHIFAAALLATCSGGRGTTTAAAPGASAQEIQRGFLAMHDASSAQFQPVLSDPTGVFSLGFLRVNSTLLDLAVVHLPSSIPLWRAIPDRAAPWSAATSLSFDGSLVLTDRTTSTVLWSTAPDTSSTAAAVGDRVVLLGTSNLQIQASSSSSGSSGVVWQSFDFPSDTIVQNQNFTSAAALFSSNRRFSMRLGANHWALFVEPSALGGGAAMYWKHTAMEAKAQIVPGGGAVYARVDPDGFFGMYQKEGPPADVLPFDTFNRGVRGLRRVTLEPDGNLRAYCWDGSAWALDYTTITEPCELPTTCGSYSVCAPGGPAGRCACLANATDGSGCVAGTPAAADSGGLCGRTGGEVGGLYSEVRRRGVELANKELVGFETVASKEECEGRCARNCSCWGAVYSNITRYCYLMDYPAQMLVEGDARKAGYFKVMNLEEGPGGPGGGAKVAVLAVLAVVVAVAAALAAGFVAYRVWERRRRRRLGGDDEGRAPGPYKNLGSFNSIELSNLDSFRR